MEFKDCNMNGSDDETKTNTLKNKPHLNTFQWAYLDQPMNFSADPHIVELAIYLDNVDGKTEKCITAALPQSFAMIWAQIL